MTVFGKSSGVDCVVGLGFEDWAITSGMTGPVVSGGDSILDDAVRPVQQAARWKR